VDRSKISVSGASSGGAMATHMHVAYSSVFMGVGVLAGSKQQSYCCYLKSFLFSDVATGGKGHRGHVPPNPIRPGNGNRRDPRSILGEKVGW